jgi:hypothetical protein
VQREGECVLIGPCVGVEQINAGAEQLERRVVCGRSLGLAPGIEIEPRHLQALGPHAHQSAAEVEMRDDVEAPHIEPLARRARQQQASQGQVHHALPLRRDQCVGGLLHAVVQEGIACVAAFSLREADGVASLPRRRARDQQAGFECGDQVALDLRRRLFADDGQCGAIEAVADAGGQRQRVLRFAWQSLDVARHQLDDVGRHGRAAYVVDAVLPVSLVGIEAQVALALQRLQKLGDEQRIATGLAADDLGQRLCFGCAHVQRVGHQRAQVLRLQRSQGDAGQRDACHFQCTQRVEQAR